MTADPNSDDQAAQVPGDGLTTPPSHDPAGSTEPDSAGGTGEEEQLSPPWWGVDSETGQGYFGPMSQADAIVARDDHERREFIELVRQAPVWEGTA